MGTNCGVIQLRVPAGGSRETVVEAVQATYVAHGAKAGPAVHRKDLAPLHVTEGRGKTDLGVAVSPERSGWLTIIDSERYSANAALARELARRLETTVFWRLTADVSSSYQLVRYGPSLPATEVPGDFASTYYDQLEPEAEDRDWVLCSFSGLPVRRYLTQAPEVPELSLRCGKCRRKTDWQAGSDDDAASEAEELPSSASRLDHTVLCVHCSAALVVELQVDNGVIVGAKPGKSRTPKPAKETPPEPQTVCLWLDSDGAGKPSSSAIVALHPAAALIDLARDERNLGLGLLRGRLDNRGSFGLMRGQTTVLKYWTRQEFFELFRETARAQLLRASEREALEKATVAAWAGVLPLFERTLPALAAQLTEQAGGLLVQADTSTPTDESSTFGGMRVQHVYDPPD